MLSLKATVIETLDRLTQEGATLTTKYPKDWSTFPIVLVTESMNTSHIELNGTEYYSEIIFLIDIFHSQSTTDLSLKIDALLKTLGFKRVMACDAPDPNALFHKVLRYRLLIQNQKLTVNQ